MGWWLEEDEDYQERVFRGGKKYSMSVHGAPERKTDNQQRHRIIAAARSLGRHQGWDWMPKWQVQASGSSRDISRDHLEAGRCPQLLWPWEWGAGSKTWRLIRNRGEKECGLE